MSWTSNKLDSAEPTLEGAKGVSGGEAPEPLLNPEKEAYSWLDRVWEGKNRAEFWVSKLGEMGAVRAAMLCGPLPFVASVDIDRFGRAEDESGGSVYDGSSRRSLHFLH